MNVDPNGRALPLVIAACIAEPWCIGPIMAAAAYMCSPEKPEPLISLRPPQISVPPFLSEKSGAGRNDPHGDGGREEGKRAKQLNDLQEQLKTATQKERGKIQATIKNIKEIIARKKRGETHWR
jgi:hypothetical protein